MVMATFFHLDSGQIKSQSESILKGSMIKTNLGYGKKRIP